MDQTIRSSIKKAVNIHIISQQKANLYTIVPPNYKYVDCFSNIGTVGFTMTDPFIDPFVETPEHWLLYVTGNGVSLNDIATGTKDYERTGSRVDLKRLQIRLVPIRYGLCANITPLDQRTSYQPTIARLVVIWTRRGSLSFPDVFGMRLNTKPQGILLAGLENYFSTNTQYVFSPLNQDNEGSAFITLIDKVILLPAMRNFYQGPLVNAAVQYNLEGSKYNTNGLKPLEFDIDLTGLFSIYANTAYPTPDDRFYGAQAGHTRGPSPITGGIRCYLLSDAVTTAGVNHAWRYRGYTRVFYEDT